MVFPNNCNYVEYIFRGKRASRKSPRDSDLLESSRRKRLTRQLAIYMHYFNWLFIGQRNPFMQVVAGFDKPSDLSRQPAARVVAYCFPFCSIQSGPRSPRIADPSYDLHMCLFSRSFLSEVKGSRCTSPRSVTSVNLSVRRFRLVSP